MYMSHTVFWPGAPASTYRRLLASVAPPDGELQLPRAIFHRGPDGRPLPGVSPFRFSARTGSDGNAELVLTAIGPQATELLRRESWKITHLLSASAGQPLADRTHPGYCEIRAAKQPQTLRINRMITSRRERTRDLVTDPHAIRGKILAGLEAQLALLGHPLPEEVEDAIYDIRPSAKTFATPIAGGQVAIGPVEIEMDAAIDIRGPWSVGSLASRGFGRILHARRSRPSEAAA